MFIFSSRSFLLAFLFAAATFIECVPLAKPSSSLKNVSTSMFNSSFFNDSSLFYDGNESHLSNESYGLSRQLASEDFTKIAVDYNGNVRLVGGGEFQLQNAAKELNIKADLENCGGDTLFCYKASRSRRHDRAISTECPTDYCAFKLTKDDAGLLHGNVFGEEPKDILESQNPIRMQFDEATYGKVQSKIGTIRDITDRSCDPAFEDGNLLFIKVVRVSDQCDIQLTDAQVYHKPEHDSLPSSGNGNEASSDSSEAGIAWYLWVFPVIAVLLLAGGIIAGFVICWHCKIGCFKRRAAPPPKPTVIVTEPVHSTVIKKAEDGDSQMIKSKEKTKDETTVATEEVVKPPLKPSTPAPVQKKTQPSKKQFRSAIKSLHKNDALEQAERPGPSRPPVLAKPKSFLSASLKSALSRRHRDSRDEQAIDVPVVLDTPYSCMKRKDMLSDRDYKNAKIIFRPDAKREPTDKEVFLLSEYVSDAFTASNLLIVDAQNLLKKNGVVFMNNQAINDILPNTPTAEYLQKVTTPDYVRFVAYGANYGEQIGLDEKYIVEYSMPLLMVIVLTPFIKEDTRRHALAVLKRNAPAILAGTLPKERKKYGYPSNALEAAYKKNPRCFERIELVKTVSSPNVSEVIRSEDKTTRESKEIIPAQRRRTPVKKTTVDDEKDAPVKPLRRNTFK